MCKAMEDLRNESYAEGREEGRKEGYREALVSIVIKKLQKGMSAEIRLKRLLKSLDSVQTRLRSGL